MVDFELSIKGGVLSGGMTGSPPLLFGLHWW